MASICDVNLSIRRGRVNICPIMRPIWVSWCRKCAVDSESREGSRGFLEGGVVESSPLKAYRDMITACSRPCLLRARFFERVVLFRRLDDKITFAYFCPFVSGDQARSTLMVISKRSCIFSPRHP